MVKTFTKSFTVAEPVTHALSLDNWRLSVPDSGTVDLLKIDFGQALDHQLIMESININDVNGSWKSTNSDKSIVFNPESPWTTGTYQIIVDPKLEDLAGNNLHRPFDRDVQSQEFISSPKATITFKIQ